MALHQTVIEFQVKPPFGKRLREVRLRLGHLSAGMNFILVFTQYSYMPVLCMSNFFTHETWSP